jgi:acid stress-induced BolA-like protein IbaG/YrbA
VDRRDRLAEQVKSVLQEAFPPPDQVRIEGDDGIIAIVVSERFSGMDDFERQDLVWEPLKKALERDARREIAIVLPVTPKEEAGYSIGWGQAVVSPPAAAGTGASTLPGDVP